jgi:addiction module HigA family antidote
MPGRVKTHPGEILLKDYMIPLDLTLKALAYLTDIDEAELLSIVQEVAPVELIHARAFSKLFRTSIQLWINLQEAHDKSVRGYNEGT